MTSGDLAAFGEAIDRSPIRAYGCRPDEAAAFAAAARTSEVRITTTEAALTAENAASARGCRCVSVGHRTPVGAAALRALRDVGVRYLSTRSIGEDHIDVDCARRLGIVVAGVSYSPDGVADHALMLMLMAVREAGSSMTRMAAGDFRLNDRPARELRDLTVGVVGTGRIGAAVVERLRGFGCRVLACDPTPRTAAEYVTLAELLRRSDAVTLHAPLRADTRHLLDRERIALMRRDAVVVNTGRGALIDTAALVEALEQGELGGAALDVVEGEEGVFYADRRDSPPADDLLLRLLRLPNVVMTPHSAFHTDRALRDVVRHTIRNCLEFERSSRCRS